MGFHHTRVFGRPVVFFAVASIIVAGSRDASAQDASLSAARRELIEQAQQARTQNDHPRALNLAQRAAAISDSASLRLFIAQEQSQSGNLADAYGNAEQCARDADNELARIRDAVRGSCRALADALRARVGRVIVRLAEPIVSGTVVRVNGRGLPEALWGASYVVSPGRVHIDATPPNAPTVSRDVDVAVGSVQTVELDVATHRSAPGRDLAQPRGSSSASAAARGSEPEAAQPGDAPAVAERAVPRRDVSSSGGRSSGGLMGSITVMSVGAASLAAAGVFFALRLGATAGCTMEQAILVCPDAESAARARSGATYTTMTNVFLVGGIALVAGGATWLIVDRVLAPRPRAVRASVVPVPGGAMVGIGGAL